MDIEAMLALPAGRELDTAVAELRGWRLTYWPSDESFQTWRRLPTGELGAWHRVPHYSADVNAALSLLKPHEEGVQLELHVYGDIAAARISIPVSSRSSEAFPTWHAADKPALAIVRAWLAYHKATAR